ncbi:CAMK/RAD53 protein kinase [Mycena indigotica]|uniref:CAMK/RAD53 protein kinase n=1 Tax=Mycena indigotica TaxID=2126181 RepID=A0A8H6TFW3_9AGAR|nr:CAMK/RAD53 protein kinase [Mycena indigotica]KAF7315926.1 CAMK/RAD53 protein kinase [Mycena indigotica]
MTSTSESSETVLDRAPSMTSLVHWGYLESINPSNHVQRITLKAREVHFGRAELDDGGESHFSYVVLPGDTVSTHHATFRWNGERDHMATVMVSDQSTNGTYVDGLRIGPENVLQIFDGHEICFGCLVPIQGQPDHDYRYTFHFVFKFDTQPGVPTRGRRKTEALATHYHLQNYLGGGAHGVVHKAIHKTTGTVWAVKSSFKDDIKNESFTSFAGQEVLSLLNLRHQNICRLKEVFFRLDGQVVDCVLEYVAGAQLDSLGFLNEEEVREIAYQLSAGITHMHGRNIYHGDLKPNNVMLTYEHPVTVKIIDFGMARLGSGFNLDLATRSRWSAPESYLQLVRLTFANTPLHAVGLWDSWSLGLIIFYLLSSVEAFEQATPGGERPFETGVDVIRWHHLKDNSPVAQEAVQSLLVVDPVDRSTVTGFFRTHEWLADYLPNQTLLADADGDNRARAKRLRQKREVVNSKREKARIIVDAPRRRRSTRTTRLQLQVFM